MWKVRHWAYFYEISKMKVNVFLFCWFERFREFAYDIPVLNMAQKRIFRELMFFCFFISLPPEFLPVVGPLTRWCATLLGAALLCSSRAGSRFGANIQTWLRALSIGFFFPVIYWTWHNHQYRLRFEDVYLELNAFTDRESNPGPFDLELTVLTVIPPCFGELICYWLGKLYFKEKYHQTNCYKGSP